MTSALFGLSNLAPEGVGQTFRTTMRRFPATVTVITACASGDQRDHGRQRRYHRHGVDFEFDRDSE